MPLKTAHLTINLFLYAFLLDFLLSNHFPHAWTINFTLTYFIFATIITPDRDLQIPFMKHRGISHSCIAWVLVFALLSQVFDSWIWGGLVPVVSHIVVDGIVSDVKRAV